MPQPIMNEKILYRQIFTNKSLGRTENAQRYTTIQDKRDYVKNCLTNHMFIQSGGRGAGGAHAPASVFPCVIVW